MAHSLVNNNNVEAKALAEALKPVPKLTFEPVRDNSIKVNADGTWFNIEIPKSKFCLVFKAIVPLNARKYSKLSDRLVLVQNINSRGEGIAWAVLGGKDGEALFLNYVLTIAGDGVALSTVANVTIIFGNDVAALVKKHELLENPEKGGLR